MRRAGWGLRLVPVLAILVSGCGSDAEITAKVREFRGMPLYWLGDTFEGEELSHVGGPRAPRGGFGVIYGPCVPLEGEGGCAAQLPQIQTVAMCFLDSARTTERVRINRWKTFRIGENLAVNRGGALVLLGDDFEVRIFGDDPAQARRAARALLVANDPNGPNTPAGPLPAPPRGADQRLPCEGNPPGIAVLPPGRVAP